MKNKILIGLLLIISTVSTCSYKMLTDTATTETYSRSISDIKQGMEQISK